LIFHKKEKSIILRASSKDLLFMAIKKTTRKPRAIAAKPTAPRPVTKPKREPQGHHLAAWFALWAMYVCVLIVSIAFLTRVDWKWLTAYAYEQTHQEEITQEQLVDALDKATCEMAAAATAASTSTCSALGFIAAPTATSTSSTR
jgi:ABC-type Fe3+ transport system permease subunit